MTTEAAADITTPRGPLNASGLANRCLDDNCGRQPTHLVIEDAQVQRRVTTRIACYCPQHVTTEHVMGRDDLAMLAASRDPGALPFFHAAARAWPNPVRLTD